MTQELIDTHRSKFKVPRYLRSHFLVSLGMSCLLILVTTIAYFQLQPIIPLFYSLPEPNDYLAPKIWIFIFPAVSSIISVGHLLLVPIFRYHDRAILQLFGWLTLLVQFLCLVAAFRVILIIW